MANLSLNFRLFSKCKFLEGESKHWYFKVIPSLICFNSLPPKKEQGGSYIIIHLSIYEYLSVAFTHVPIVLISLGAPIHFSLEHCSIFHFLSPLQHHFNHVLPIWYIFSNSLIVLLSDFLWHRFCSLLFLV